MVRIIHRVRYPPFESGNLFAERLPIAENDFSVEGPVAPPFKLGSEDSWIVERIVDEGAEYDLTHIGHVPPIVDKQRTGWYLLPHPIHAKARKFINLAVVVLLFCLFYLFTTPIQSEFGIPTFGTGKVRLGMLDYPLLAVIVVPLLLIPIVLRVIANFGDLRRQRFFLNNAPSSPIIELSECQSGEKIEGSISIPEKRDSWKNMNVSWRVGILPPARHKIFSLLGRNESRQPPPGLTTPLPHHWEKGLDDGTGMGEDAPMERHDVPGGVFLRPMRIMEMGGNTELDLEGGKFKLEPPKGEWPGCMYGDLIRVHWELIVKISREKEGPLLWVLPLEVSHKSTVVNNEKIAVNDGRSETFVF